MLYEDLVSIIKEQNVWESIESKVLKLRNRCLAEVRQNINSSTKPYEIKQLFLRINNSWNLLRIKEAQWLREDYPLELFKEILPADLYDKVLQLKSN